MATWTEFATSAPELAEAIRGLVHQFGQGFGYLATVRDDGGPRVHPVSPLITHDGLFCFLIDSPKRRDLDRDGRYALHSFPPEDCDDEAYVAGRAVPVADPDRRARLAHQSRAAASVDWQLYEFLVDAAMLARRDTGVGGPAIDQESAHFTIWRDPASLTAAPSIREVQ
ncbi:pyridoxamine 5'-phosphate oxidase family protein [Actinocatenispora rupis]|uniref:Pyridoxamine 5'-phosphate oxidase N-terminal domain-containing protein n=1 Tax=Actinocatenispora rupis TaxID=519421 RepID=A0A8J3JFQ9_9ACTN|nr:pyridoxamine 5'-phosphate oxidase family protein [Actinocatenispora rupis]GID14058.1 hypothetical protein Aru02nite_49470 [Actinocatenispora rupis]